MFRYALFIVLLLCPLISKGYAVSGHTAVVTRLKGTAVIFSNSQGNTDPSLHRINFEGEEYAEIPVKQGAKLGKGDVIQTGADSQARLIFKNGDSLSVGPATSYKINWGKDDSAPLINIFYGKVRGIFKKDGPRTGTAIHTKTSVMGVRGTDFYVVAAGSTAVSVLRGEVNLRANKEGAKSVSLQTGFTAKIMAPSAPKTRKEEQSQPAIATNLVVADEEQEVVINPITKKELVEIQVKSTIKTQLAAPGTGVAPMTDEGRIEVAELEKQSVETVMSDIKVTDPVLYDHIVAKKSTGQDLDNVNTMSVGELFKKAPATSSDAKPGAKDLDGLGNDVYDRYFKVD